MKNLKKLSLILIMLHGIATVGLASYDEQSDISPAILKQAIYDMRGFEDGFKVIGEDFEAFVDNYITSSIPDNNNIDAHTTIELLNGFQEKANDLIIAGITPRVVDDIECAIRINEHFEMDNPTEFARKHPALDYALEYKDSLTKGIFKNTIDFRSGEITKSVMNKAQYPNDNTFLAEAFINKNASVCEFLLAGEADDDVTKYINSQYLHAAVNHRAYRFLKLLIKHGVDVNKKNDNDLCGNTPLHDATGKNADKVAQLLINNGANVNAINNSNSTPLHHTVRDCRHTIAQLLIKHGANVNARDNDNNTPLHSATFHNSNTMAQMFIQHGADVNARTNDGNTPLHIAIVWSHNKITQMLIQHGADVNARNNKGNTPLHNAAALNNNEIAQRLIQHGADINARNNDGNTPSDVASKPEMQNLLRARQQELAWSKRNSRI